MIQREAKIKQEQLMTGFHSIKSKNDFLGPFKEFNSRVCSSVLFSIVAMASLSGFISACGVPSNPDDSRPKEWGESVSAGTEQANQILNMSLEEEYRQAEDFDIAIKDPSRKNETGITIKTIEGRPVNQYVNRIAKALIPYSVRPNISYRIQVVDDDSVNAFATMGGYLYIQTGLIKAVSNEAQLAAVMAHELGHIGKKHAIQSLASQASYGGWARGAGGIGSVFVALTSKVLFQLPGQRGHEFEADMVALQTLRQSGYPASELVSFFRKILAIENAAGKKPGDMLSTHPDTERRIKTVEEKLLPGDYSGIGLSENPHQKIIDSLLK